MLLLIQDIPEWGANQRGGGTNQLLAMIFAPKLHENETKFDLQGARHCLLAY